MSSYTRRTRILAAAQEALGSLEPAAADRRCANINGQSIFVRFSGTTRGKRRIRDRLFHLEFPLPSAVPIHFQVEKRAAYSHIGSMPQVEIDDPDFNADSVIFGWPTSVIAQNLDEEARRWFQRQAGNPTFELRYGTLHWSRIILDAHERAQNPNRQVLTAEVIRVASQILMRLGNQLVEAYVREQLKIRKDSGEAAASAWHEANVARLEAHDTKRSRRRIIVYAIIGVMVGVPMLAAVFMLGVLLIVLLIGQVQ